MSGGSDRGGGVRTMVPEPGTIPRSRVGPRLRPQAPFRAVVLMGTGRSPERHALALDAGADVYLPKPFEVEKLLAVARELIASRAPGFCASTEHEVPTKGELSRDELTNLAPARVAG